MPTQAQINAGDFLIQCLDVLVDPTEEALPVDDPNLGPLILDPSSNNNADGYGDRNPGRMVRAGGSGIGLTRESHNPLKAVDDFITVDVGSGVTFANVLDNDFYTGTPTIVITSGPILSGATAAVSFSGDGINYTAPSTGSGGQDIIGYKLTASGSRGSESAKLYVAVVASNDPHPGGVYTLTGMGRHPVNSEPNGWTDQLPSTVSSWNGGSGVAVTFSFQPTSGGPFGPDSTSPPTIDVTVDDATYAIIDDWVQAEIALPGSTGTLTLGSYDAPSNSYSGTMTFS